MEKAETKEVSKHKSTQKKTDNESLHDEKSMHKEKVDSKEVTQNSEKSVKEEKTEIAPTSNEKSSSELNFWRITTIILAILFVISLYTNGFKFGANDETTQQVDTLAVPQQSDSEAAVENSGASVTDSLAKCLTENGVTMYGAEWCSHCQAQKKLFGDSFQYINWVDCDKETDKCNAAGVQGYPTWVINGQNYPGEQTFERLAQLSGCSI